ncbi:MAG: GntR family transcriptional regulator [Peptostreptococcaceae bacterium]|nr:GntR family transcriptional regulator [Peptostreptococcaceae bacterium]
MADNGGFSGEFSLTDEIAKIIRERILNGEYKIGEKIKESQIAAELKVSRTPIREAFKLLENEGLIDYFPYRGCYAKGFTKQDIYDIYAVRKALEELAVEWAVEKITTSELEELKDQCDLMEFYTSRGESQKVLDMNNDFHDIIYKATRSRFISQVLKSYKTYVSRSKKLLYVDQNYLKEILGEHREILQALTNKDKEASIDAVSRHLDHSQKRAEAIWRVNEEA